MYLCSLNKRIKTVMGENEKDIIQEVTNKEYEFGFTTDIDTETIRKGLAA